MISPARFPLHAAWCLPLIALLTNGEALAHERWDGCATCHGSFTTAPYAPASGAPDWPDSLHQVHIGSSYMKTDCNLCHSTGDGNNPYLSSSTGTTGTSGQGCLGCHGSVLAGNLTGAGLRQHHQQHAVTSCTASCHAAQASAPESTAPPYYGSADTNVSSPCNQDSATSEDWSGDGRGLDNDGDLLYDGDDPDCQQSLCGNAAIDPGETCDPPSACPSSCYDGNACTVDALSGAAATCDVRCSTNPLSGCKDGDGCCPDGCGTQTDDDCSTTCGNSIVGPKETCDPPSTCPSSCSDGNACTADTLTGNPNTCNVACSHVAIATCADGDGCCPPGCAPATDDDCADACGDGQVDPGETCDPPESCPATCNDGNACTLDVISGSAVNCNAACAHSVVVTCVDGDGCCPAGCTTATDDDCSGSCGNSRVDPGERCDPASSCPASCDDGNACTVDALTGSAANCSAACSYTAVVDCVGGDGCCPMGCDAAADADCSDTCGNGTLEPGETCDPPGSCPTSCDDGNGCTREVMTGNAASCNVACTLALNLECAGGDDCCPAGCEAATDPDCSSSCDDTTLDPGETCDPGASCPTSCPDGDACTKDLLTGSAANCNSACTHFATVTCAAGDGCCPPGCDNAADSDCSLTCGNGALEQGETCDPPSSCPATCDDGEACTYDQMTGTAATCDVDCVNTAILDCMDGDGCCPAACNGNLDSDCPAVPPSDGGVFDAGGDAGAGDAALEAGGEAPAAASDDGGCGCSVPTQSRWAAAGWLAVVMTMLAAAGMRRRRRAG